jgi:hypothetical protein
MRRINSAYRSRWRSEEAYSGQVRFARNGLDEETTEFRAISESEAQKLKKISLTGTYHDEVAFFVATEERTRWRFNVRRSTYPFPYLTVVGMTNPEGQILLLVPQDAACSGLRSTGQFQPTLGSFVPLSDPNHRCRWRTPSALRGHCKARGALFQCAEHNRFQIDSTSRAIRGGRAKEVGPGGNVMTDGLSRRVDEDLPTSCRSVVCLIFVEQLIIARKLGKLPV